jgi:hypothetical protein
MGPLKRAEGSSPGIIRRAKPDQQDAAQHWPADMVAAGHVHQSHKDQQQNNQQQHQRAQRDRGVQPGARLCTRRGDWQNMSLAVAHRCAATLRAALWEVMRNSTHYFPLAWRTLDLGSKIRAIAPDLCPDRTRVVRACLFYASVGKHACVV